MSLSARAHDPTRKYSAGTARSSGWKPFPGATCWTGFMRHNDVLTGAAPMRSVRVEDTVSHEVDMEKGFTVTVIELLVVVVIIGILAAVATTTRNNWNDPTEVLKTKDWQCLETEEREYTYPIQAGKMTIMQTGRREECILWKRKDG